MVTQTEPLGPDLKAMVPFELNSSVRVCAGAGEMEGSAESSFKLELWSLTLTLARKKRGLEDCLHLRSVEGSQWYQDRKVESA